MPTYNYFWHNYFDSLKKMEKIRSIIAPATLGAISSVLIYKFVLQSDLSITVPFTSMELPAYQVIGLTSLIGNVGGELIADYTKDKIPKMSFLQGMEDSILPPVFGAGVTYAIFKTAVSEDTSLKNTVLVSIGGAVSGKYVYNML